MIDYGYFEMGQSITRAIVKGLAFGAKGGFHVSRAVYSHHLIQQDNEQYNRYETTTKNPPAPYALQSYNTRSGVFFGKQNGAYIRKPENMDGHTLIIGGTGSGKTSCIAIPTLRTWRGRVFAIDIKGELYDKTRTYRPNTRVFNPLNLSYGYDPYHALRISHNPAQDAKAIAQAIIPKPPDIKDPFWIDSAQNLFTGAILHFYHAGYSFINTIKTIQRTPPNRLIEEISRSRTEQAAYYVNNFIGIADTTLSGIVSELSRNIVTIATDHNLVAALSKRENLSPADLERGSDVYIQIPEHLLNQWNPIITLIVNQFISYFEQRAEYHTTPILFLLDEFPRLGRVPAIHNGLATLRSRKVTICLVIQNIAQLGAIYGRENANVILGNCDYKAVLGASDYDTQKYLSALCGVYLKRMGNTGYQQPLPLSVYEGVAEQYAPILQEAEFGTMRDIVLISPLGMNSAFCRVQKCPYYAEG
jgi:type IV secretion system protein VirD4